MGIQRSGRLENLKRRLMGPDAPIGHRPQALLHHLFLPALTVLRRCSSPTYSVKALKSMFTTHLPWKPPQRSTPHDSRERRRSGPIQPISQSPYLFSSVHPQPCFRPLISTAPSLCSEALYKVIIRTVSQCHPRSLSVNDLSSKISKPPFQSVAKVCTYMMVFTSLCDTEGGCSGTDAGCP